jgi:hypothetical protein
MSQMRALFVAGACTAAAVCTSLGATGAPTPPSAPQIACQISMQTWCITNTVERIDMTYDGHNRIWKLGDRLYMTNGPLTIVEHKANCSQSQTPYVRKLFERSEQAYQVAVYSLTQEDGCVLEFDLPLKGGTVDEAYRQVVLYQILVNGQQLYALENGRQQSIR